MKCLLYRYSITLNFTGPETVTSDRENSAESRTPKACHHERTSDARVGIVKGEGDVQVSLTVNGAAHTHDVEPRTLLVNFIREQCGLTGTNIGCDTSSCGACTIHIGGESVKSCTVLAVQADGADITTIEGLADGDQLHPMQQAFMENHGLQCGYCTPGMIMAATSLLDENPHPTEREVRVGLEGNLCRCTGYHNIVKAILAAAEGAPA